MYDNNNIFAKIIDGKIPCKKIYEDKDVLFFEDINPVSKTHILGIPKVKCVDFSDFISGYHKDVVANFFQKTDEVIEVHDEPLPIQEELEDEECDACAI